MIILPGYELLLKGFLADMIGFMMRKYVRVFKGLTVFAPVTSITLYLFSSPINERSMKAI